LAYSKVGRNVDCTEQRIRRQFTMKHMASWEPHVLKKKLLKKRARRKHKKWQIIEGTKNGIEARKGAIQCWLGQ